MYSIYIAAFISTLMAFVFWGGFIYYYFFEKLDKYIFLGIISALSCPIVNLLVKAPLLKILKEVFNIHGNTTLKAPIGYLIIFIFLPSITEETIKILPSFFLKLYNVDSKTLLRIAYILGFGFGIGEIWYIAYGISKNPSMAGYPFFLFGGFATERFLCVIIHAGLTVVALTGLKKDIKSFSFLNLVFAILLHTAVNISAFTYQLKIRIINEKMDEFLLMFWPAIFVIIFVNIILNKIRTLEGYF
ncbi:hypothetical protein Calkr_0739 [Caldicellulosiruptor acetigenus I77R1B]|uniref:Uncharacterized protein n=1 Tax=Caldicellulosiruptor acetigenus (strain ATCC 700853 / DSM 12137 / I77R1B) TaxID=632335 RepID=E4S3W6_CALA7|nr:YhfC family intramembrane metalloprotease [Caldicellulosiruptor acetigenus]ADQ40265.1 hypothetical protein Calkr_0739 [Caldicellulosiruptor acetigenus I77R1B]